mmetsp:Transcript_27586/g.81139  ORF Transcript_27586/g.81139 Transcript_27586/m.81139 type:complete len:306 (-) Transcript_27586:348-1265(-)
MILSSYRKCTDRGPVTIGVSLPTFGAPRNRLQYSYTSKNWTSIRRCCNHDCSPKTRTMTSRPTISRRLKRSKAIAVAALMLQSCNAFVHLPKGKPTGSEIRSQTWNPRGGILMPSVVPSKRKHQPSILAQSTMPDPLLRRKNDDTEISPRPLKNEDVPSTMNGALRRFFLGGDHGPLLVVVSISYLIALRLQLANFSSASIPFGSLDGLAIILSVVFWWFQEHFLHGALLHSQFDWVGKSIHQDHHEKDYFSVSIDPPALLIGWMAVAHAIMRLIFPLPLALSATVGYAIAGLWYEWAHFLAHTR